jgi:hypothetical protein
LGSGQVTLPHGALLEFIFPRINDLALVKKDGGFGADALRDVIPDAFE